MRYQYTSPGFRRGFSRPTFTIPSGVKLLVIINIVVFILTELSGQRNMLFSSFGLVPNQVWTNFKVWQLFTYLFVHGGFLHIFFNMFVLWMFGKDLEIQWGKNEFLLFYFTCGIGAGLMTVLFSINSIVPIVGASGAIYGLLVAYGFTYPNRMVYLYGLFPLKVKYMVLGLGAIAFFASLSANQSNVSHITHLSGMIIGVLYIYFILNWKNIKMEYYRLRLKNLKQKTSAQNDEEVLMKKKVDEILDKLNASGWDSLTEQEEKYLTQASKELFGDHPPN
ncbi:rhomboid family intramembrane serine protease [Candidatus Marinimicrobia bacterium PRS2]|nr:rhomboid family intramembrane serine protease [Candidatus Marinimicrobia bacterium PRS2]